MESERGNTKIGLSGELYFEEAVDLSQDRLRYKCILADMQAHYNASHFKDDCHGITQSIVLSTLVTGLYISNRTAV